MQESSEVETEPTDVLDSLAEEDIERLVKSDRVKQWRDTERNAGAQAREAELKRQSGNDENVMQRVDSLLEKVQDNPASSKDAIAMALKNNREWVQHELLIQLPDALIAEYEIPKPVRDEAVEWFKAGNADRYVKTLIDSAVKQEADKRVEDRAQKLAEKQLADLIAAHEREHGTRLTAPPATPSTNAGSTDGRPSLVEYNNATAEQRAEWREKGIEPRVE